MGESEKCVQILNEYGSQNKRESGVTSEIGSDAKSGSNVRAESSTRNKALEAQDEFMKQIEERKRLAAENPWPEKCEARVIGNGGRWQMQIEVLE